jgi:hypothetical protein
LKTYKESWPAWLVAAVTPEKEKAFTSWLGDPRLGDLWWGDLWLGDLWWGDLWWGDLRLGDLRWGDLWLGDLWWGDVVWMDYFDVLWRVPEEVGGLIAALKGGRVNGSAYEGPCACLCGTIAKLQHCKYTEIPGLVPDSSRPIERFFLSIKTGDTPETNPVSALVVRWAEAFQQLEASAKP